MMWLPPRSTRTGTRFTYPTLFRSGGVCSQGELPQKSSELPGGRPDCALGGAFAHRVSSHRKAVNAPVGDPRVARTKDCGHARCRSPGCRGVDGCLGSTEVPRTAATDIALLRLRVHGDEVPVAGRTHRHEADEKIGRASCRERWGENV